MSRGQRANTGRLVAQIPAKLIPCQGGRIRCCSFYLEECKIYLTLSLLPDHVFWAEKEVAGGAGMRSFLHRSLIVFSLVFLSFVALQMDFQCVGKTLLLFRYALPFCSPEKYEQEQSKDIEVI